MFWFLFKLKYSFEVTGFARSP